MKNLNRVMLQGRPTKEIALTYSGEMAIAKFTLASGRGAKKGEQEQADFIPCVAFGKTAEFINKWFSPKSLMLIEGHLQTGSYTNREGKKIYTEDVVVDAVIFSESAHKEPEDIELTPPQVNDGFMQIPESADDSGLPFN